MKWEKSLIEQCYKIIQHPTQTGGEVRIQFSARNYKGDTVYVPIIKTYPANQIICDEVKIDNLK